MSRQLAFSSTISAMVMALFVVTSSVHAEAAPPFALPLAVDGR